MREAIHIGKAATLAGVSVDTIRFYQKLGLIKSANRSAGGYRLFDGKRLTNTPVRMAAFVLQCPDDRKNGVVSTQATYTSGSSAVGG